MSFRISIRGELSIDFEPGNELCVYVSNIKLNVVKSRLQLSEEFVDGYCVFGSSSAFQIEDYTITAGKKQIMITRTNAIGISETHVLDVLGCNRIIDSSKVDPRFICALIWLELPKDVISEVINGLIR